MFFKSLFMLYLRLSILFYTKWCKILKRRCDISLALDFWTFIDDLGLLLHEFLLYFFLICNIHLKIILICNPRVKS